jgi:DnaK suppressor protein
MSRKKPKASKPKSVRKPAVKGKSKPAKAASAPKKAGKASASPKKAKSAPSPKVKAKSPAPKVAKPAKTAKPAKKTQAVKAPAKPAVALPNKPKMPPFPIKGSQRPFSLPTSAIKPSGEKPRPLGAKFLEKQRKNILELRDHILDQMQGVANDSLKSADNAPSSAFGMHQADAGSDAYEKDFALSLLSQEQDALYEIEEALKRIEQRTYGTCEMSGQSIPLERLEAIPFARYTVQCQEQLEREQKGKNRWETAPQFMDSAENFFEEEDDSEDESQKLKE